MDKKVKLIKKAEDLIFLKDLIEEAHYKLVIDLHRLKKDSEIISQTCEELLLPEEVTEDKIKSENTMTLQFGNISVNINSNQILYALKERNLPFREVTIENIQDIMIDLVDRQLESMFFRA